VKLCTSVRTTTGAARWAGDRRADEPPRLDFTFFRTSMLFGIGFRVIWNLVSAVSFDYGLSSEGQIFFMNLGYAF
jgi:hypothetical protein